jgi:hypothetical protein
MSIMNNLIDPDTGAIDMITVVEAASLHAAREWGGTDYPPVFRRHSHQVVMDRARDLRREWLRQRGLPDDSTVTMAALPDWGSAGDSYRRQV